MGSQTSLLLIGIKLKLLFEIAALYGCSAADYRERLYLLYVFQLAFSSDAHRRDVYLRMVDWTDQRERLPESLEDFDWRTFQQEYRDYIDLAKLAQLVPVIGAPVGFIVNSRLITKLGRYAMNAYRMRWFEERARRAVDRNLDRLRLRSQRPPATGRPDPATAGSRN